MSARRYKVEVIQTARQTVTFVTEGKDFVLADVALGYANDSNWVYDPAQVTNVDSVLVEIREVDA